MIFQVFCITLTLCLLVTVSASQKSQNTLESDMQKELESDKAYGRYVVWLCFTPAIKNLFEEGKGKCLKENVAKFLEGKFTVSLVCENAF